MPDQAIHQPDCHGCGGTYTCAQCGRLCGWCHAYATGERRHEYDHYLGYAPEHHEHVQAVCTTCHGAREVARRNGGSHANQD